MTLEPTQNDGDGREDIRLPGASLLPFATAAGITLALVGLMLSWLLVTLGVLIVVIAVLRWVRVARVETAELPSQR